MTDSNRVNPSSQWTSVQAYTFAVVCLLVGIAGGWFIRGSQPSTTSSPEMPTASATDSAPQNGPAQPPTAAQLKQVADTQAAPLLEKLKSDPNNAAILANLGNVYYDAQQYPVAIEYYKKSLDAQPTNSAVRTDMGTAYWYTGNADAAISEFNQVLKTDPTNPNTLFNLGIVRLHGKRDVDGAVAAWKKLLESNPTYPNKDKVEQLIQQAEQR
jgi:cytochrome c-type biogenesis protein CcmH/NrfG